MSFSVFTPALTIAEQVNRGKISARDVVETYLARIQQTNNTLNAYTHVLNQRALALAEKIDQCIATGNKAGPLAGVPFAVKNLFDIKGIITLAGSKINRDNPPAIEDATLIKRLENAGAILIGALAMGEYAYDFTGENCHYGNCGNPWAPDHMSGGSSSGSGSATAAGLAPISLGSDTNGSIRVPASFCGLFGLKPTYGRLPRTGTFPFCDSLDHLGPLARNVKDLALSFDTLQGFDAGDHACVKRPSLNTLNEIDKGIDGLRIKKAVGYFACDEFPQAEAAVNKVCKALTVHDTTNVPGAMEGRSAAYLITNIESSALHVNRLRTRAGDFDPDTRDRFIAGALLPASWYVRALQVRKWYHDQVMALFKVVDVIIAPATPCTAPMMGQKTITIRGVEQLLRPNLGYFTQPISAIGLPTVVVPTLDSENNMPIGVQIIAAPWREDLCIRVAAYLEAKGFTAPTPPLFANGGCQ